MTDILKDPAPSFPFRCVASLSFSQQIVTRRCPLVVQNGKAVCAEHDGKWQLRIHECIPIEVATAFVEEGIIDDSNDVLAFDPTAGSTLHWKHLVRGKKEVLRVHNMTNIERREAASAFVHNEDDIEFMQQLINIWKLYGFDAMCETVLRSEVNIALDLLLGPLSSCESPAEAMGAIVKEAADLAGESVNIHLTAEKDTCVLTKNAALEYPENLPDNGVFVLINGEIYVPSAGFASDGTLPAYIKRFNTGARPHIYMQMHEESVLGSVPHKDPTRIGTNFLAYMNKPEQFDSMQRQLLTTLSQLPDDLNAEQASAVATANLEFPIGKEENGIRTGLSGFIFVVSK